MLDCVSFQIVPMGSSRGWVAFLDDDGNLPQAVQAAKAKGASSVVVRRQGPASVISASDILPLPTVYLEDDDDIFTEDVSLVVGTR